MAALACYIPHNKWKSNLVEKFTVPRIYFCINKNVSINNVHIATESFEVLNCPGFTEGKVFEVWVRFFLFSILVSHLLPLWMGTPASPLCCSQNSRVYFGSFDLGVIFCGFLVQFYFLLRFWVFLVLPVGFWFVILRPLLFPPQLLRSLIRMGLYFVVSIVFVFVLSFCYVLIVVLFASFVLMRPVLLFVSS